MAFALRDDQQAVLSQLQDVYRSWAKRVLLVAPTGWGKSTVVQHMLRSTKKRTLILVHRENLRDAIAENIPVPYGIIEPGKALPGHRIAVGMIQTVTRRLEVLPNYEWIISDEAHLAMSPSWESILNHFKDAWHLGMSGSPCRLDGRGLGEQFHKIVEAPDITACTAMGLLCRAVCYAPPIEGAAEIANDDKWSGDSLERQAKALDNAYVTGDAIDHARRLAPGKQGIIFCANCTHGENVAAQYTMAGFPAVFVDGSMSRAEQRRRIAAFRAREYLYIVNVDLLTTGWDCPQVEVCTFLRKTESLALYLQMLGRVLRLYPGKEFAVILDHVRNIARHGLPAPKMPREWTLDGAPVRNQAAAIRQCPACYLCHDPAPGCPACGHAYAIAAAAKPRRKILTAAGELHEVIVADIAAAKAIPLKDVMRTVRSRADLVRMAKERGYHHRWVDRQMAFRPHLADDRQRD